ncbi:hypothetical protein [Kordia sp.]|uniref:hypothetical protein n=1 Tax=Kordia sp. TaxID=1965332 RepID=UPI003D6B8E9C
MKKLNLKKIKIATIGNTQSILGGANNSDVDTICNNTGDESITCQTNCDTCNTTNANSPCTVTHPGNSRANKSLLTGELNCLP